MVNAVGAWLERVGTTAFTWSALAFVILNAAGIAMFLATRDRAVVNRWTSRFLGANLALLGVGLGVPAATFVARTALRTLSPAFGVLSTSTRPAADELGVQPAGSERP